MLYDKMSFCLKIPIILVAESEYIAKSVNLFNSVFSGSCSNKQILISSEGSALGQIQP